MEWEYNTFTVWDNEGKPYNSNCSNENFVEFLNALGTARWEIISRMSVYKTIPDSFLGISTNLNIHGIEFLAKRQKPKILDQL